MMTRQNTTIWRGSDPENQLLPAVALPYNRDDVQLELLMQAALRNGLRTMNGVNGEVNVGRHV